MLSHVIIDEIRICSLPTLSYVLTLVIDTKSRSWNSTSHGLSISKVWIWLNWQILRMQILLIKALLDTAIESLRLITLQYALRSWLKHHLTGIHPVAAPIIAFFHVVCCSTRSSIIVSPCKNILAFWNLDICLLILWSANFMNHGLIILIHRMDIKNLRSSLIKLLGNTHLSLFKRLEKSYPRLKVDLIII